MEQLNDDLGTPVQINLDEGLPLTSEGLRRTFIERGGNPAWKRFQTGEREAKVRAQASVEAALKKNPFASASATIGEAIAMISVRFVQVIFIAGLPVALGAVLIAEGFAITEGVSIFAPGPASLVYSLALMVFLLVILFVYEVVHRSNTQANEDVFSLRGVMRRLSYIIGVGKGWTSREKETPSPTRKVEWAMVAVSRSIIFFGILGRLKPILDEANKSVVPLFWHQTLLKLITESSLETMLGLIGNILLAMTLLSSAHVIIYLIHRFYVLSTGGLDIASESALGFLAVVDEELVVEKELAQFYTDQIYLLEANNKRN